MSGRESPAGLRTLLALYRATHYDVRLADVRTATLRVGQPAPPAIIDWLRHDAFAAFISAANPHSQALPAEQNAIRLAAMRALLRDRPCRLLEGVGHIPGADWHEAGLLLAGLDLTAMDALARGFAQSAVVIVPAHGAARLRVYGADWRCVAGTAPDVDRAPG